MRQSMPAREQLIMNQKYLAAGVLIAGIVVCWLVIRKPLPKRPDDVSNTLDVFAPVPNNGTHGYDGSGINWNNQPVN